jgi:DNA-binding protein HU-beta
MIDVLSLKLGSKKAAADAVDGVFDTITRTMTSGERVAITGFGVFEKVARPARTGRNPRTGAAVKIKKSWVPKFKAGQSLKDVVNGARKLPKIAATNTAGAARSATGSTSAAKKAAPAAAKKSASAAKKTTVKKAAPAAKKTTVKKAAPAKKATVKKAAKKAAPAKKATAKKAATKKTTARKTAAKRS